MKTIILVLLAIAVMLLLMVPGMAVSDDNQSINEHNTLSSRWWGLNWNCSVSGDHIPILYTWRDYYTGDRHITDYFPTMYRGCVIITPARIAGEPLQENDFWNTSKGKRILLWKANHA